jgi:hypothetical protein
MAGTAWDSLVLRALEDEDANQYAGVCLFLLRRDSGAIRVMSDRSVDFNAADMLRGVTLLVNRMAHDIETPPRDAASSVPAG